MKWLRGLYVLPLVMIGACSKPASLPPPSKVSAPPASAADDSFTTQWVGPQTVTVARGVHVLSKLFPSAAFVIETKQGVVLIDSGVDENGREIRENFIKLGLKVETIRYILLTHAHYDHVFGANKLRAASGATVCAGRDDCQTLRDADQDAMFSLFPRLEYSGDPIQIDRELDDGDLIELGDVTIEVIGSPGHTPGSVCYLLNKDGQRILFSGDVIASLNYGPATYPVYISPSYRGNAESYLKTINRLLEMEPPDVLLTGHPSQQRRLYSIKMDAEQWKRLLEPAQAELQQVVHRYQSDGEDFLDDDAKEIEPGLWYLGMHNGIGVYGLRRNDQLVVINAPGGDQFAEFLQTRLLTLGLQAREPNLVLLTSPDEQTWSGLTSLKSKPTVVATESIQSLLAQQGIENVVSQESLAEYAIDAVPLGDSLAYSCSTGGKQVIVTPGVPRNLSLVWKNRFTGKTRNGAIEPQTSQLRKELRASSETAKAYRDAMETLSKLTPNIWLPARPLTGQNANVYDDQWQVTIDDNLRQIP